MNQIEANENLLDALPVILRALREFRDNSAIADSFCYGQEGEIGTSEVIGALRALVFYVGRNGQ